MNKCLNLWWPQTPSPGNMGDVLSPPLLHAMGYQAVWVKQDSSPKMLAIGSIARFAKGGDVVWGSGIMRQSDKVAEGVNWLAVRGPLTADKTGCDVIGDPALLTSRFFKMKTKGKGLGVIPHYIDNCESTKGYNRIGILNKDPLKVVSQIVACDEVISSSLHGIIIAHAYGIPAGWWRPGDRLCGDDSKFKDYAESVGIELVPSKTIEGTKLVCPDSKQVGIIQDDLINAIKG